jgi:hypothetical protein
MAEYFATLYPKAGTFGLTALTLASMSEGIYGKIIT